MSVAEYKALRGLLGLELLLVLGTVLCAALMARGVGLQAPPDSFAARADRGRTLLRAG
jgi:hypothetical protein